MRPPRPGPAASFIISVISVTLLRIPSAYRVSQETVRQRKFYSDCLRRFGSDAVEPLKLTSDSPELIDRVDVLSAEHGPGEAR
jgi:hypothetical protein